LFNSSANSLMGSLGVLDSGGMSSNTVVDESLVNSAFAGLDLGTAAHVAAQDQQGRAPAGFFDQSSFLEMQSQAMHPHSMQAQSMHQTQSQMPYPNDMYSAPFQQTSMLASMPPVGQQAPMGGASGYGIGTQSIPPQVSSSQADPGTDDWSDLQLQLPSDLGEILGGDIFGATAEGQQQQNQQLFDSNWSNQQQY